MRHLLVVHPEAARFENEDLRIIRPFDPLFGARFDVIIGPAAGDAAYQEWWDESVACRLNPGGEVFRL